MSQARPRSSALRTVDEISDLDKRIIEHLQEDGRRPFTQIAAELGVSEAAVRARTNRLVERGILQIVGVTDPLKLGFHQMAMIGIRCERDQLMEVAEAVAEFPEVDYVVITAGTYDLLIETVCEDNDGLLPFLAERLRRSRASARRRRSSTCGWSSRPTSGAPAEPPTRRIGARSGRAATGVRARGPHGPRPRLRLPCGHAGSRSPDHTRDLRAVPVTAPRADLLARSSRTSRSWRSSSSRRSSTGGRAARARAPRRSTRIDRTSSTRASSARPRSRAARRRWGARRPTYDRVVRIVSLVFILSTSTIVVVTGLWPETAGGHPRPPRPRRPVRPRRPRPPAAGLLGPAKFIAEGRVAITFVDPPRRPHRPRGRARSSSSSRSIVGGAALVVRPRVTVVLDGRGDRRLPDGRRHPAGGLSRSIRRRSRRSGSTSAR